MSTADSPTKVCIRCGQDCSAKQRAKDAQGRYICADCIAKAKAQPKAGGGTGGPRAVPAAPTIKAASSDDQGVLGKLIDQSIQEHKHGCPNCHAPMKASQVLCVKCGFNKERGKQVQTVVKKAIEEKGIEAPSRYAKSRRVGKIMELGSAAIGIMALISITALGGLFAVAMMTQEEGWAIAFFGAQMLYALVTWIIVLVCMFMDEAWKGIVGLICGFYMLYWVFVESDSKFLQMLYGVSILSGIGGYFLMGAMADKG